MPLCWLIISWCLIVTTGCNEQNKKKKIYTENCSHAGGYYWSKNRSCQQLSFLTGILYPPWLTCIPQAVLTKKKKKEAFHGFLNLIVLPSCTKGSDFDLFYGRNSVPVAVNTIHVPLLKVQGWTCNALAPIDFGTDCTVQIVSFFLIKSWLSERKKEQNENRKLVNGSIVLSRKRKKSTRLCTDCNYSTFAFNYKLSPRLVGGSWHHLFSIVSTKEECLQG